MNQAVLFLPVELLYNALQFLIHYLTFVKLIGSISFTYLKPIQFKWVDWVNVVQPRHSALRSLTRPPEAMSSTLKIKAMSTMVTELCRSRSVS
ncbi:hypothetical protein [Nostoc sp.]|uniref:hypothetical protein n=1 Tax=Nostoc sp. TaxID=1180 RepID=UPI002FF5504D